jgi:glycosyltransferase involved in cell wall biosynthesis
MYKEDMSKEYNAGDHPSGLQVPLVSVCVVTFQHKNYIRQCLDSILSQQVDFPYEVIIGEDESTDGTREICKEYADKYPGIIRLFLRSRKDIIYIGGKPSGRINFIRCYQSARGKYVAACEGDDYWTDPNKLQMQVSFLEAHPDFSLTHTNVNHVDKNGMITLPSPLHYKEVMTHDEVAGQITVQTLTMVFRKDALPDFPPEYYKIFNADVFLTALLSEKGKVRFFNTVTGCYRKHEGGTFTGITFRDKQLNKLASLKTMLHFFSSVKVKRNLKTVISKTYGRILYAELASRHYVGFLKKFFEVIYFDVTNFRFSFPHMMSHAVKKSFRK